MTELAGILYPSHVSSCVRRCGIPSGEGRDECTVSLYQYDQWQSIGIEKFSPTLQHFALSDSWGRKSQGVWLRTRLSSRLVSAEGRTIFCVSFLLFPYHFDRRSRVRDDA